MEQWKVITDYPEYECSNEGRVRRISDGFIRKWTENDKGSLTMSFRGGRNGNKNRTQVYLMRTYWKYEFIKDLYDGEECKVCPDYPDYFITNYARFFSLKTYRWMNYHVRNTKRGFYDRDYHCQVSLTKDNKRRSLDVSRLVGKAFLPDFQENLLVLHIDETLPHPQVNYLSNLKVGTHQDNMNDMKENNKNRRASTVPLHVKEAFQQFEEKYFDLVWYARSDVERYKRDGTPDSIIQGALNAQARVEEQYPDELDQYHEHPDWTHGFNSGCLATIRFVLDAIYPTTIPAEETDDGEEWMIGGLEYAQEEFPMLDT